MSEPIYLDYNATVPVRPEAAAAMGEALRLPGNASSVHRFGRAARQAIEAARDKVAALVGAAPAQVVFTSGGTEANALALAGSGRSRILVSAVEHESVLAAAPDAERLPVSRDGVVDLEALRQALKRDHRPALVSLMLANNETGVLQPVGVAASIARAAGALVHCDAVQAAGRLPIDFAALGVDSMSLSAHKIGGPQGCGALIVSERVPLQPLFRGGGQEGRRRAGTENLPGIAGFGAAAEAAMRDLADQRRIADLRDRLEAGLRAAMPGIPIHGAGVIRLPNTSCFSLPGMASESLVIALDLAGIAVSAGAACSSGKVTRSHVLAAMDAPPEEADSAIRVSLGWASGEADIDRFLAVWQDLVERRRDGIAAQTAA